MRPIYFFWIVFAISLYWIGYLYQDFLMNLLIAGLLCVATFWLKDFFDRYVKLNVLSSFLCVGVLLAFLIVPLYFVGHKSLKFILDLDMETFSFFLEKSKTSVSRALEYFPALSSSVDKILSNISAESIMTYIVKFGSYIGKYSLNFVKDAGFILVFLFFFFYYGRKIYNYMLGLLPFEISQSRSVFAEINGVLRVVFLTSIINVILQGFAFGAVIIWFGYDGFLLGILYGLASLIPIVGGALIWIPIAGYEVYVGNIATAIFIALYSLIFIGFVIDNLIKPVIIAFIKQRILKTPLQINEILIFFSILAGLSTFGFWGIVVGPTITAFFIALLRLYQNHFSDKQDW
ncbi:AI-2E family transporter [Helicobacter sp. 12S02232-10]|uniref:AI-2E family transporter n=1 Tax=Helicobacter sp. 12S02232-10 TaxID=1476197 RepID=UPI000BA6AA77|nr:AI-2E family transporter [Helicobacter sp. 12S02232-10]PAF46577.1 AI-2E family transporter [Helicobacter sp. 12S02232-10]